MVIMVQQKLFSGTKLSGYAIHVVAFAKNGINRCIFPIMVVQLNQVVMKDHSMESFLLVIGSMHVAFQTGNTYMRHQRPLMDQIEPVHGSAFGKNRLWILLHRRSGPVFGNRLAICQQKEE
jgi:hypothetical protein